MRVGPSAVIHTRVDPLKPRPSRDARQQNTVNRAMRNNRSNDQRDAGTTKLSPVALAVSTRCQACRCDPLSGPELQPQWSWSSCLPLHRSPRLKLSSR